MPISASSSSATLFEREAQRLGSAPLVLESVDVLRDPASMLATLCEALAIPFDAAMLSWPAGRRESDGVWAPAWYHAVEESTGFAPYKPEKQSQPSRGTATHRG